MKHSNVLISKHYYMGMQRIATQMAGTEQLEPAEDPFGEPMKQAGQTANPIIENLQYVLTDFGKQKGTDYQEEDLLRPVEYSDYYPDTTEQSGSSNKAPSQGGQPYTPPRIVYYYHPDYLGNVEYITDANGLPYQYFWYSPWGENLKEENATTNGWSSPYRFNGKEQDEETGLYYYGARYYNPQVSVWLGVDPLSNSMPEWSPFVFNFNNPITFIDPDGEKPTPAEAARMASHVYGDSNVKLTGGWKVSTRDFGVKLDNPNGLQSQVYQRTVGGVTEYAYVTAGTQNLTDLIQDGLQPIGFSSQYSSAAENAKEISNAVGADELTFVGHSLGGGEAALNALITDRAAITFNAAGVSDITKIKEGNLFTPFKSEKKIDAYVMMTDPLNFIQDLNPIVPNVNGVRHDVIPLDAKSLYDGHSIVNFVNNMIISITW